MTITSIGLLAPQGAQARRMAAPIMSMLKAAHAAGIIDPTAITAAVDAGDPSATWHIVRAPYPGGNGSRPYGGIREVDFITDYGVHWTLYVDVAADAPVRAGSEAAGRAYAAAIRAARGILDPIVEAAKAAYSAAEAAAEDAYNAVISPAWADHDAAVKAASAAYEAAVKAAAAAYAAIADPARVAYEATGDGDAYRSSLDAAHNASQRIGHAAWTTRVAAIAAVDRIYDPVAAAAAAERDAALAAAAATRAAVEDPAIAAYDAAVAAAGAAYRAAVSALTAAA